MARTDIRLALPSKGALYEGTFDFLAACGLKVYRPNPRQYAATIPALPGLTVMFQRPGDIVTGVREGSVDFGITGYDVLAEKSFGNGHKILTLHEALGYGLCTLNLAAPEDKEVQTMADVAVWAAELAVHGRTLRIATKFPNVTGAFLDGHEVRPYKLVNVEGTLEIAPAIGFADLIADLVSSGVTLRDNHLRPLDDGQILASQAVLIANKKALQERPDVLAIARHMLEYIEAHLRAAGSFLVTANIRGESPEAIAAQMRDKTHIAGLQGPTISRVITHDGADWFAINIVVRKPDLFPAIAELRAIGGSGVIVAPCTYIFEEEPVRYKAMVAALANDEVSG
ncbi:MAG TPA: ATP phosphoribosyltransferase [Chloroflexota bacterium]|nr:ATP phosphoribosyltransferase [Chloroflexota bacterium]